MKKVMLVLAIAAVQLSVEAQVAIPYPAMATFDAFKTKELTAAIKYAEDLKGFKINMAEFKATGKSEIIGFRREETNSIYGWPNDGCYVRYFYENPKLINGMKVKMEVVSEFKRSHCEGENCYLEDSWKPFVVNAMPFYEHSGMTKKEAEDLAMLCIKSKYAKDSLLKDYISISSIEVRDTEGKYLYEKITSPNLVEFRFGINGKVGGYYKDRSLCLATTERSGDWYTFSLKFENGKWNVVTSTEKYNRMFSSNDMSLTNKELPTKRFVPYSEAAFEEIWQKTKEGGIPATAPINSAPAANDAFINFIVANSDALTKETLAPFFISGNDEFNSDVNASIERLVNDITPSGNGKLKFVSKASSTYKHLEEFDAENGTVMQKCRYRTVLSIKRYEQVGKKLKETATDQLQMDVQFVYTKDGWKAFKVEY